MMLLKFLLFSATEEKQRERELKEEENEGRRHGRDELRRDCGARGG